MPHKPRCAVLRAVRKRKERRVTEIEPTLGTSRRRVALGHSMPLIKLQPRIAYLQGTGRGTIPMGHITGGVHRHCEQIWLSRPSCGSKYMRHGMA